MKSQGFFRIGNVSNQIVCRCDASRPETQYLNSSMNKKPKIPMPAHLRKRREALPLQQPKATEEDPEALQRVQTILNGLATDVLIRTLSFSHAMARARRALTD